MAIRVLKTNSQPTPPENEDYKGFEITASQDKSYDLDKIAADKDRTDSTSPLVAEILEASNNATRNPGSVAICRCEPKKTTTSIDYSKYLLNDIPESTSGCCNDTISLKRPVVIWTEGTEDNGSNETKNQFEEFEDKLDDLNNKISSLKEEMVKVPEGGFKKEDLSEDVQNSLSLADTALQEHQDLSDYITAPQLEPYALKTEVPTIHEWALSDTKPTYDISELNDSTEIINSLKNRISELENRKPKIISIETLNDNADSIISNIEVFKKDDDESGVLAYEISKKGKYSKNILIYSRLDNFGDISFDNMGQINIKPIFINGIAPIENTVIYKKNDINYEVRLVVDSPDTTYKNIKNPVETEIPGMWRITKINSDLRAHFELHPITNSFSITCSKDVNSRITSITQYPNDNCFEKQIFGTEDLSCALDKDTGLPSADPAQAQYNIVLNGVESITENDFTILVQNSDPETVAVAGRDYGTLTITGNHIKITKIRVGLIINFNI